MNEIHSLKVANKNNPVDTGRKLNVHKTFRRRPERLMYVQFTSCVNGEVSLYVPMNGCSSNKNFDDLEYLLKNTIAVTGTRITRNISKLCNISLKNYAVKSTPTESSKGGTLLYIAHHLSYKPRSDPNIYKKSELESTFVETIIPERSNIVGVIDRYPSMDVTSTLLEWAGQIRYKKNIFLRGIS